MEVTQNPNNEKKLKMVCASFYIPKHDPNKPLGEDAHFICPAAEAAGVADGVGGWCLHGVDSGVYARELMSNSAAAVLPEENLKAVLSAAFAATRSEGSSTACLIRHRAGVLRSANVGDSGVMILRRGRPLGRSRPQQRGFNSPFQLGALAGSDRPDCAEETATAVEAGDVVVLATDGFFDNVFPDEAGLVLEAEAARGLVRPDRLAFRLVERALWNSVDRLRETPFSAAAKLAGVPCASSGGKVDDITVVVGLIVDDSSDHDLVYRDIAVLLVLILCGFIVVHNIANLLLSL